MKNKIWDDCSLRDQSIPIGQHNNNKKSHNIHQQKTITLLLFHQDKLKKIQYKGYT